MHYIQTAFKLHYYEKFFLFPNEELFWHKKNCKTKLAFNSATHFLFANKFYLNVSEFQLKYTFFNSFLSNHSHAYAAWKWITHTCTWIWSWMIFQSESRCVCGFAGKGAYGGANYYAGAYIAHVLPLLLLMGDEFASRKIPLSDRLARRASSFVAYTESYAVHNNCGLYTRMRISRRRRHFKWPLENALHQRLFTRRYYIQNSWCRRTYTHSPMQSVLNCEWI